ncbi:MAG: spore germination protein, partial [Clostridiales bacterium]|nr:spore germination protein [Clostridiales bacterium]
MSIFKKLKSKSTGPDSKGNLHLDENRVEKKLCKNIQMVEQIFKEDGTLRKRTFENQKNTKLKCCSFFIDGMVDNKIIDEYIIKPIMISDCSAFGRDPAEEVISKVIVTNDVKKSESLEEIVQSIVYGDTALFIDGSSSALIISTKGWKSRGISEPDTEKGLRGPREGFTEALMVNLSMLRRKIYTPDLKFKFRTFGTRSNTKACVCYLESLADEKVV